MFEAYFMTRSERWGNKSFNPLFLLPTSVRREKFFFEVSLEAFVGERKDDTENWQILQIINVSWKQASKLIFPSAWCFEIYGSEANIKMAWKRCDKTLKNVIQKFMQ